MAVATAVKRTKVTSSPPRVCDGMCYWQSLARAQAAELAKIRLELIKSRVLRKKQTTILAPVKRETGDDPEVEPFRPGRAMDDELQDDLVDIINRRG